MNTSMKLSKADVLFHVRSFPETSWQIYNDVEVAHGEADHKELADKTGINISFLIALEEEQQPTA